MTNNNSHWKELDAVSQKDLAKAAGPLNEWGVEPPGEVRYSFYRRKGHAPADALAYALAWCRNAVEQSARRKSHETGCAA